MRNSLVIKLVIIFVSCIAAVILATYVVKLARNSNSLTYNLGKDVSDYEDMYIKSYEEYLALVKKYNIKKDLTSTNFSSHYFIASFQDYDSCSEKKYKLVKSVKKENGEYNVNFEVYNKCGWCKKNIVLYLIEVDRFSSDDPKINYNYTFVNDLNCGNV